MNKTLSAQDVASMSQDEFDQLDDGVINSLLTGSTGGQEPPPASNDQAAHAASDPAHANGGNEPQGQQKAEDGDDPEAITIDEDGRARNAKGKFVPHKALHAEREEHKKTRASLQQAEIEKAKYSERLAMLLQAIEPDKPAAPAAPAEPEFKPINVEEDLIGALKQMQELAIKGRGQPSHEVRQLQERVNQMDAHNQVSAISNRYASDVQTARADTANMPEFEDAVRHLVMQQDAMLAAQGWNDPAQRRAEIQAAERNFVLKAYREGANPATRLYAMAKAVGWNPKAVNGGANGSGQPSAVEQRIDSIARMQRASPSLSNVPSGGGDSLPSAAQVAAMNEEEFDALVSRFKGGMKEFEKRYMGRER